MPVAFWRILKAVELSGFSKWIREANSIWAYPTVLFLHTVGLAFAVGISIAISLRVLGFGSRLPVKPMDKFFPIIWAGFWLNAFSGTILLASDATAKFKNPVFYIKMAFIFLAVITVQLTRNRVFRNPTAPVTALSKILAASSIFLWLAAIVTGRLLAYLTATHIVGSDN
jgi:hypothetical protein